MFSDDGVACSLWGGFPPLSSFCSLSSNPGFHLFTSISQLDFAFCHFHVLSRISSFSLSFSSSSLTAQVKSIFSICNDSYFPDSPFQLGIISTGHSLFPMFSCSPMLVTSLFPVSVFISSLVSFNLPIIIRIIMVRRAVLYCVQCSPTSPTCLSAPPPPTLCEGPSSHCLTTRWPCWWYDDQDVCRKAMIIMVMFDSAFLELIEHKVISWCRWWCFWGGLNYRLIQNFTREYQARDPGKKKDICSSYTF